jgi:hypothetical protein
MCMNLIKKKFIICLVLTFTWFFIPSQTDAQCPMCRISAESNLKSGGTAGKGLNKGILYLFFTPYVVIGTLGYLWWKNRKSDREDEVVINDFSDN